MWRCPRCSNEEKGEYICKICGYDHRKDFVSYRTLQPVKDDDVRERKKNIEQPPIKEKKQKKQNIQNKGRLRISLFWIICMIIVTMARDIAQKNYLESVERMMQNTPSITWEIIENNE